MFGSADLIAFLLYFGVVIGAGFLAGRGKRASVEGYFRGDHRLAWYTIGMSIVAAGVSSEQFVGEAGLAYRIGMPTANWEWIVFPSLTILLWFFVPLYVRERVTTMPEYLERRFGGTSRTLFAWLSIASFVFVNFPSTFYAGGLAMERMWGIPRLMAVLILAVTTGAYTIYGGLTAVAWTSSLQCVLLMGGGLYVFVAGMQAIHWDFAAMLGSGGEAHLIVPANNPDLPWTALVVLMLSTNTWFYATNQYINQRCLAAKNEWHAKLGILLAGGLQLLLPLATCMPGMICRVLKPNLANSDHAYTEIVSAVVPSGMAGLVVAAILGAIMSSVAALVNSTATLMTLDIVKRSVGQQWPERRLVRFGQWAGAMALVAGIVLTPLIDHWDSMFRYAQDLWAPMAAPTVVVFLAGALWPAAAERGSVACLVVAILTVPFTLFKSILAEHDIFLVPATLENSMVGAAVVGLMAWVLIATLQNKRPLYVELGYAAIGCAAAFALGAYSSTLAVVLLAAVMLGAIVYFALQRRVAVPNMWDRSMFADPHTGKTQWVVWLVWLLLAGLFSLVYGWFW
ncbi:MAG: sodium/solute symporter [Pirellulales bacterium]|nr:sodium/solute symporter [Pirellulales bacterium]